jgi:sugar porter (SP) family MFS transporter
MQSQVAAPAKEKLTTLVIVVAVIAAVGGILFGYDTGVISGAILYIVKDFNLSSTMEEVTTSAVLIGAIIGALLGGWSADALGRRWSIIVGAVGFLIGTLLCVGAGDEFVLLTGRIFIGIAIGLASFIVPMYISEMAPASSRGWMTSLNQVAVTAGILLAYGIDYIFSHDGNWRAMFAFGLIPGAILLVGMWFMPFSPRWLLSKNKDREAEQVLQRIRGTADVRLELQETRDEIATAKTGGGLKGLESSALKMPLTIGLGLAILQQLTGINTVIYYSPTIFLAAGFKGATASIAASAGVGAVNLIATIIAAFLVDRAGRRPLLLLSMAGMVVALVILGVGFIIDAHTSGGSSFIGGLTVVSLMIYIAAFAIGMGPIFWLLIAEIYPLAVRGTAMSLATVANWGANFLVTVTFLSIVKWIGQGGTFLLYAAIGVFAFFFIRRLVPETKGQTLEQIQVHWRAGKHPLEMGGKLSKAAPTAPHY